MTWKKYKIKEVASVIMGQSPSSSHYNNTGEGLPFIQGNTEFSYRFPKIEKYTSHVTKIADANSILFTVRAPVGSLNIADKDICIGRGLAAIKAKEHFDNTFLYYLLYYSKEIFRSKAGGAIYESINKSEIENTELYYPSLFAQHRIASILSAYDDLIENNLKRIKLLEEAAQNIYREWFLEMRFPDHEKVKWYSDEQGRRLPVGWKYVQLIDMCDLIMGQSPKSEFYNDNKDGLPFHQGVTGYGFRFVEDSTYCTMPTRIANEGDILCSVRAPVGRLNITMNKIIIGRGLSAIRNRQGFQSFQYYQLKSHFHQEDMIGGGAIFNSVTKKVLSEQLLILPSANYLNQFESVGIDIDHQIQNLSIQNQRLREARDILLPRLMNQTIRV